jgi:hypothetical protein
MATNQFGIRNSEWRRLEQPMGFGSSEVAVGSRIGMTQAVSHQSKGTESVLEDARGHTVKDFRFWILDFGL